MSDDADRDPVDEHREQWLRAAAEALAERQRIPAAEVNTDRCAERRGDLRLRLELCSLDELRVIGVLLARLELGRQRYGYLDLARDRRDFKRERAEEYVDLAIYDACDELDRAAKDGSQ